MSEQIKRTLYLLETRDNTTSWGWLFTFYAKDIQEAEAIAQGCLTSHPELYRMSLTCKPHGFTIMHSQQPGHIVCQE